MCAPLGESSRGGGGGRPALSLDRTRHNPVSSPCQPRGHGPPASLAQAPQGGIWAGPLRGGAQLTASPGPGASVCPDRQDTQCPTRPPPAQCSSWTRPGTESGGLGGHSRPQDSEAPNGPVRVDSHCPGGGLLRRRKPWSERATAGHPGCPHPTRTKCLACMQDSWPGASAQLLACTGQQPGPGRWQATRRQVISLHVCAKKGQAAGLLLAQPTATAGSAPCQDSGHEAPPTPHGSPSSEKAQ